MVEEVLLNESAIKRLVEPHEVASLVGWLAVARRRHGDRRVLHHRRWLERPLSSARAAEAGTDARARVLGFDVTAVGGPRRGQPGR